MWQILLLLMSCESSDDDACPTLWQPPTISGGTEEQRDAVMTTWSEFADDVRLDPPNVRVAFVDAIGDRDSVSGRYINQSNVGIIYIDKYLDINSIKNTMYHELCHAYDHQRCIYSEKT